MTTQTVPTNDEIDDRIDDWHEGRVGGKLHEAVGWSREDFDRWVVDHKDVPVRPLPPLPTSAVG